MESSGPEHKSGFTMFNRKEFLAKYTDRLRGFRLVTKDDVKPNAELFMVVVQTDFDSPQGPFLDPEPIRLAEEPVREVWDSMGDEKSIGPGVSVINKSGKPRTILMSNFLDETCEVVPLTHQARVYLART
jgi:hypothetical protein